VSVGAVRGLARRARERGRAGSRVFSLFVEF
jgi:hypothetical protein